MEPTLRGFVEQVIDEGLKSDHLENARTLIRSFEPLVKSEADAIFGHLVGTIRISLFYYVLALYNRTPTQDEINQVVEIIHRRASEIRSKIFVATTK